MIHEQYSNLEINPNELKNVQELSFNLINKKYLNVSRVKTTIIWISILAAIWIAYIFMSTKDKSLSSLALILGVIGSSVCAIGLAINQVVLHKAYLFRGYSLRELDITYRKGVFLSKYTTMPYSKIQQVSVRQDPISRLFGLYNIDLKNGSQDLSALTIHGLEKEEAEKIKSYILRKIR